MNDTEKTDGIEQKPAGDAEKEEVMETQLHQSSGEGAPEPEEGQQAAGQKKKRKSKASGELEKALAEKEEYMNALIRERADFENFKKRNQTAVSRAYLDGKLDAATALLPVVDNLERALASAPEESPLKTGVEMVLRQTAEIFRSMDIEEIQAEGAMFDPNLHNAVMQEPAAEGEESGAIREVLMKGYRAGERVLRHSMVKVAE